MRRWTMTPFVVLAGLLTVSVVGFWTGSDRDAPLGVSLPTKLAANLETFSDCDELADYFEEIGVSGAGVEVPVGVPVVGGGGVDAVVVEEAMPMAVADSAGAAGESAGAAAGVLPTGSMDQAAGGAVGQYSQTNVQERGVDEPDIVKTDGRLAVLIARNALQVVDVSGGEPRALGRLALDEGGHELFLSGDRAVVLTRSWSFDEPVPVPETLPESLLGEGAAEEERARSLAIAPGTGATVVTAVDLADPAQPTVAHTKRFEGEYVSARMVDGVVRMVLRSGPDFRAAQEGGDGVDAWLPEELVGAGGEATRRPLVECDAVARPPEPSGSGTSTIVTFAVDGSLDVLDSDAVVADAQTVYASADTLYLATNAWHPASDLPAGPGEVTTALHAFDISSPTTTEYVASGRVRGHLLNQWSLSEHEGHLRVATTDGSPWAAGPDAAGSESFLTVLARRGDRLEQVGQVGGLGPGERIYAVRYFGDIAFVVTFRQVDPLYSLDLSDPASPRIVGELKITGFSEYLHPVGEGRLLGLGQDADESGVTRGLQISLFDVSDLADVKRIDQVVVPNGSSAAEHDHRAFLWWRQAGLAVVPATAYHQVAVRPEGGAIELDRPGEPAEPPFVGAIGFSVGADSVREAGRVTHPSPPAEETEDLLEREGVDAVTPDYWGDPEIVRALVVGDRLYTVSHHGLMASDVQSLAPLGFLRF